MFSTYLAEDFSDNEEMFAKDITKWSSNDLMDKIETIEADEAQGRLCVCHKLTVCTSKESCLGNLKEMGTHMVAFIPVLW